MSVTGWVKNWFGKQKISEPQEAYDTWSLAYDDQHGNLMLDLDEGITGEFLEQTDLKGKTIVDIGCGTGRHWAKLFAKNPGRVVGFDVSTGMLEKLIKKYPGAETHVLKNNQLEGLGDKSVDLVISTLTIAHIEHIEIAFEEWNRVLKPGGGIFITENHPEALARGGQRTFKHEGKLIAVRNYIHSFEKIRSLAGQLGWKEIRFTERVINDSVKHYYERKNALAIFEKFRGVPVFYGIYLKKKMILHDARWYGDSELQTIRIENGIIASFAKAAHSPVSEKTQIELMGATVLPGFINSHDHLDFNCYPALGDTIYSNYTAWGPDIQSKYASEIKEVQSIPQNLRINWGIYKNLLNGFTTVVNHGATLPVKDELISIFHETESLHSPAFEKNWKWKLNNPFKKNLLVAIHVGEGTDTPADDEIDVLIKANKIGREIIAIHGVSMNEKQAGSFKGLVWCPASNLFLLGKTAAINELKKSTTIVFGTDSTLTSPWNCWEHFRAALGTRMIEEKELLEMLTVTPAAVWKLNDREKLEAGKKADLLVVKEDANLFSLDPADILIVMHAGEIRLIDSSLGLKPTGFTEIVICGKTKYVQGDPVAIAKKIKNIYPRLKIPFDHE